MIPELEISLGQYSDKGRKEINQDFHGALFPVSPSLGLKGITVVLADGISSSAVSQIAAESTVKSLLTDYYCTSDTWTVKTSVQRVISATNSWAYAQTKRSQNPYDMDKGFVCTLSAVIFKSHSAHVFHVGDSRVYRLSGSSLEQLTIDHRQVVSAQQSYLARAIGMSQNVDIDYCKIDIAIGDVFILATDGVYEFMDDGFVVETLKNVVGKNKTNELDDAARVIAQKALSKGSTDNLTIQIVRVDQLPEKGIDDFIVSSENLPVPPLLEARQQFEGYEILRQIHSNSRSHIYLAKDIETDKKIALKIPSIDLRDNVEYLKRFVMEEWIARRINNAHVLKANPIDRKPNFVYVAMEFVEGQTLAQWMIDNPAPSVEEVRDIVEQIAIGLRAFHRKEMIHQDLRPHNIMIDNEGTVKIIDFGSVRVAGVVETGPKLQGHEVLGTLQYTAPECFVGEVCNRQSDFFSLGIITYQMLTGKLPFGTTVSKVRTRKQQMNLRYISAKSSHGEIPAWIDGMLRKAVHPDPFKRYDTLSEFLADLRKPNKIFTSAAQLPLVQRNPTGFWQAVSFILALVVVFLVLKLT